MSNDRWDFNCNDSTIDSLKLSFIFLGAYNPNASESYAAPQNTTYEISSTSLVNTIQHLKIQRNSSILLG